MRARNHVGQRRQQRLLAGLAVGQHERQARIAEMRIFGGLSSEETGIVLGLSKRTVEREMRHALERCQQQLGKSKL